MNDIFFNSEIEQQYLLESEVERDYLLNISKQSKWFNVSISSIAKESFPYIQEIGEFIAYSKYYTRRRNLPSYYLDYTLSGEGILEYQSQKYLLKPEQIFWIDCMNPQYYATSLNAIEWRHLWVHFYGKGAEQYYKLFLKQNNNSVTRSAIKTTIAMNLHRLLRLYDAKKNNFIVDLKASAILTDIMTECISCSNSAHTIALIPSIITDAQHYIDSFYAEKITLDSLSNRFHINKHYFLRQFKRYLGDTPGNYLLFLRLYKAKELLRLTNLSINQIANNVGFENVGHFITIFKKNENITPGAFRKIWLNDNIK
jgi:AraC-like DNA-binding protein